MFSSFEFCIFLQLPRIQHFSYLKKRLLRFTLDQIIIFLHLILFFQLSFVFSFASPESEKKRNTSIKVIYVASILQDNNWKKKTQNNAILPLKLCFFLLFSRIRHNKTKQHQQQRNTSIHIIPANAELDAQSYTFKYSQTLIQTLIADNVATESDLKRATTRNIGLRADYIRVLNREVPFRFIF